MLVLFSGRTTESTAEVKFEINESLIDGCDFDEDEVSKFGARYIKREIKKKILKELENRVEVR